MPLTPDQIIAGKYRLKRHLARGGMGAVWQVEHVELGADFALKVLRPETLQDDKAEARFRREARAAAQLKSPHVVQVHDFGVAEGAPYLVMELLAGENLDEYLERCGPLSLGDALLKLEGACLGLALVHDQGLVHRDIKPSNLFLAEAHGVEVIKLLDFGIAKAADGREDDATTQGLVLGSPAYMSPEQARGGEVDHRSDLWSLGSVFYRMLLGRCPFEGKNPSDLLVRICTEELTLPSTLRTELGASVDQFFRRALARDPAQRFQSALLLWEAAESLQGGTKPAASRGARARITPQVGGGRVDETAPLPAVTISEEWEQGRPGRVASKPLPARWIWIAIAALIGVVLWFSLRKGSPTASSPEVSPTESFDSPASPVETTPSNSVRPEAPSPPSDRAIDAGLAPLSGPPPAAPTLPGPASEPARRTSEEPKRSSPRPHSSPSAREPKEQQTDPMFGLPVGSP